MSSAVQWLVLAVRKVSDVSHPAARSLSMVQILC